MNNIRGTRVKSGKHQKAHESHDVSTTQLLSEAGIYWDCWDRVDDYNHRSKVVDKSLSTRLELKSFGMRRLLNQGKPFISLPKVVRETSKSKRKVVED